jgi:hypothetical protein
MDPRRTALILPSVGALTRAVLLGFVFGAVALTMIGARKTSTIENKFWSELRGVKTVLPSTPPALTQESIDLALSFYNIRVPGGTTHPVLDLNLKDRGLTLRSLAFSDAIVTIGPPAFESWALLGSTLAHEIEVHCQQNFAIIFLMDSVGLDGTGEAERQAYLHELKNARRFGLKSVDRKLIEETMAYFYPVNAPSRRKALSARIRQVLAGSIIQSAQ